MHKPGFGHLCGQESFCPPSPLMGSAGWALPSPHCTSTVVMLALNKLVWAYSQSELEEIQVKHTVLVRVWCPEEKCLWLKKLGPTNWAAMGSAFRAKNKVDESFIYFQQLQYYLRCAFNSTAVIYSGKKIQPNNLFCGWSIQAVFLQEVIWCYCMYSLPVGDGTSGNLFLGHWILQGYTWLEREPAMHLQYLLFPVSAGNK